MTANNEAQLPAINALLTLALQIESKYQYLEGSNNLSGNKGALSAIEEGELVAYLEHMAFAIVAAAEEAELRGVEAKDEALILHGQKLREQAGLITETLTQLDLNESASGNQNTEKKKINKSKATNRRSMLAAAIGLAGVAAVSSTVVFPKKAHAIGGAAVTVPYLVDIIKSSMEMIKKAQETVNEIQEVGNFINDLNNTFIRGVDSLFQQNESDTTKMLTANSVAADRQVNTMLDIARTDAELNSNPGLSGCISDASSTVIEVLDDSVEEAGEVGGENAIEKNLIKGSISNEEEGVKAFERIKNGRMDSLNGSRLLFSSVEPTQDAQKDATDLVDLLTEESGNIYRQSLEKVVQTSAGRQYIKMVAVRESRRSIPAGVLASINEGRAKDEAAFKKIDKTLLDVINAPSRLSDSEEEQRFDMRLVSLASTLRDELQKEGGESKAISYREMMDFSLRRFTTPTYMEAIRASGPASAPLLREIIDQATLNLRYQSNIEERLTQMTTLLSVLVLEIQDSPDRISALNSVQI